MVGVHMVQVAEVAVDKATLYLVTEGISGGDIERVGLRYATTPQEALEQALAQVSPKPRWRCCAAQRRCCPCLELRMCRRR